ncbi:MAG: hypothetical protein P8Y18_02315 [Candidatus Bathyarchaeota archaeon]
MKAYLGALIEKSNSKQNSQLETSIQKAFKQNIKKATTNQKENNMFLFVGTEKDLKKPIEIAKVEKIEEKISAILQSYYNKNKTKLKKLLKEKQELKETSNIVKDFLKVVDPKLPKTFAYTLKKVLSDIPDQYSEIQQKSLTLIWDLNENKIVRLSLTGSEIKTFTIPYDYQIDLEGMTDKLVIVNFFLTFLDPTLTYLRDMQSVLERLNLGLQGRHYKINDTKTQNKLEMFFRIVQAKLSALQNMDKTISTILNLFNQPKSFCMKKYDFKQFCENFDTTIRQVSWKINTGKALLKDVQKSIDTCQIALRDYFDETKYILKTVDSIEELKLEIFPLAELCSDLFIQAELLKMWLDFFGSDLPYFTFQNKIFRNFIPQDLEVSEDTIISVRGLVKNYNLGKTRVYALRVVFPAPEFPTIATNSPFFISKSTPLNA